jgi:hypothetical protein
MLLLFRPMRMQRTGYAICIVQLAFVLTQENFARALTVGDSVDAGPLASDAQAPSTTAVPTPTEAAPTGPPVSPAPPSAPQPMPPPVPPAGDSGGQGFSSFGDAISTAATDVNLTLKMYGDTGFSVRNNASWLWANTVSSNPGTYSPGVWNSFFAPRIDLFGSADVGRLSFLTEVMFEGNHNNIAVDVERVQLNYLLANWLRLHVGRSHLAWGYYMDTYHHGNLFELTTSRPYAIQFEDSSGIILAHNVGVGADGTFGDGAASFRYDVEVGNGHGADITSVQLEYAEQNQKSVNIRLRWMPVDGLIIGINGLRDVIPTLASGVMGVPDRPRTEELVAGAHIVYTEHHFLIDIEGFAMRHNPVGSASDNIFGGFAELGYSIGAFTPYLRPEYIRFPASPDIVYQYTEGDAQGLTGSGASVYSATRDFADLRVGIKWMPIPQLALKLEGERLSHDAQDQEIATAKVAFGF